MVNVGVVSIVNSTITGNSASLGGTTVAGGVQVNSPAAGSVSTVESSTFTGNSIGTANVTAGAGGLLFNVADANVVSSTITANSAGPLVSPASAGGIEANISTLTLRNSTLSANTGSGAAHAGNIQVGGSERHALLNTIISDGIGPASAENCVGTFSTGGGNIENRNQCGLIAAAGDQPNTNPLLGPLQDNGGPTQTMAITPGSPAFDTAIGAYCPARDQRGVPRPQGAGCDSGAVEFGAPENLAGPSITGTARVFSTLTCSPGTWRGGPTFAFAWLRNGVVIPGAGGATYRLTTADQDKAMQCRVTAADAVGSTSAVSAAVGVAAFPLPVNQRKPSISGTLRAGRRVRCNAGRWSGSPSFSFAWLRDGSGIRRANGSRYKISGRDVGHALQCQVTAPSAGGSVVALSAPRVPAKAKPKPKRHH
jgi:hypothetical protein